MKTKNRKAESQKEEGPALRMQGGRPVAHGTSSGAIVGSHASSCGCPTLWLLASGILAFGIVSGCVRRTVTVNTNPQNATVILNDQYIGTSPASVDFTWYGDYSVIIKKDGFETLDTHQRLDPPWYQIPPIDFVAEALMPLWIHDRKQMSFTLEPRRPVDRADLVQQAREVRDRALYEGQAAAATRPESAETQPAG